MSSKNDILSAIRRHTGKRYDMPELTLDAITYAGAWGILRHRLPVERVHCTPPSSRMAAAYSMVLPGAGNQRYPNSAPNSAGRNNSSGTAAASATPNGVMPPKICALEKTTPPTAAAAISPACRYCPAVCRSLSQKDSPA